MIKTSQLQNLNFERPEDSPGFLLWQVAMCWQRKVNKVLMAYGLTYTQFIVLVVSGSLKKQNKDIYQHQAARYARIDRMMTSRIITSLEKKNYMQRLKESGDARANVIRITEQGTDIMLKALQAVSEMEAVFFKGEDPGNPTFVKYMQQRLSEC